MAVSWAPGLFGGLGRGYRRMQPQPIGFRIVSENLAVAAPVEGGFDLPLHLILGKMAFQNVAEEFERHGVVGLVLKAASDLLDQRGVRLGGLAKEKLPGGDVRVHKPPAARSELDVAAFRTRKPQEGCALEDG